MEKGERRRMDGRNGTERKGKETVDEWTVQTELWVDGAAMIDTDRSSLSSFQLDALLSIDTQSYILHTNFQKDNIHSHASDPAR